MSTTKILFLHVFSLRAVAYPPMHCGRHLRAKRKFSQQEKPCALVGNSNGAFLAQIVASRLGLPRPVGQSLFGNDRFLIERIGVHEYKSPWADGHQQLVINQPLIDEFAEVQAHQWDNSYPELSDRIWGLFGENDHLAHFEPLFLQHYMHASHFPGTHMPTAEEVREYYASPKEELMCHKPNDKKNMPKARLKKHLQSLPKE